MKLTGYYVVPGKTRTLVHAVKDGKPICGCRPKGDFQFCGEGFQLGYIDCLRCNAIVEKETFLAE